MADLNPANSKRLQPPQDDEDVLGVVSREAQEAVRRIAQKLHIPAEPRSGPEADPKYRLVCQAYEARRDRKDFFDADLFGEPVWDLLLAMYRDTVLSREMTVESTAETADVPHSTAIRWIAVMHQRGLVTISDEEQGRTIALTETALAKLDAYLERLRTKSLMRVI
jgi:hypothetical protein